MGLQKHSKVLNETVEKLSDECSYKQLFHAYRDEEALPSGEVLEEPACGRHYQMNPSGHVVKECD